MNFSYVLWIRLCIKHFTCSILFKPSCCTEYRACHNLTHVYTFFHASLPSYKWIRSFSDFLSLLFLAQSYSSVPPELGVLFFVFIMHLEYTLHWPCLSYYTQLFIHLFSLSMFQKLMPDSFMFPTHKRY